MEVDGRPVLAFEAERTKDALHMCREHWVLDDLATLKSSGVPLRAAKSKLSVRLATSEERNTFEQAAPEPSGDMLLVFLVKLDP
jgi:hypothetical protein